LAAHKKYFERYDTAVSVEKKEFDLTRTLGITLSDALRLGIYSMVQTMISQQDQKITSAILEQFVEIQKRDMEDLKAYIRMQDSAQKTLDKMIEMKKEEEKPKDLIKVWDPDDGYVRITKAEAEQRGLA